ncbi:hypothetical protein NK718_21180 [Alsobacter sp. SYSU M60028]|uniref:Uncharacterized protein n=1 Tax=Alsobacter ponti TaxID=2962936 RepID=A0ABT1LLC3_9HYPH|nr:hypothetical protein [Alsobacter ponti]MCP8941043.1 hypothetical protein [Alsobacter ponti]
MRHGLTAVALGGDDSLHARARELVPDPVGVLAIIRQQRFDLLGDHVHERAEALGVLRLTRRPDKGERAALDITPGAELRAEPAAQAAKRFFILGLRLCRLRRVRPDPARATHIMPSNLRRLAPAGSPSALGRQ